VPSTKSRLLNNSSKTCLGSPNTKKFDYGKVYNTSPTKIVAKKEKNVYKMAELSN
jgi:hypothetical protein